MVGAIAKASQCPTCPQYSKGGCWNTKSARSNEEYQICPKDVKISPKYLKGVNVVEYCKCEGFTDCSTQWDPYDGKSITQAQSDQYKVGIFTCKMIKIISKRRRNC